MLQLVAVGPGLIFEVLLADLVERDLVHVRDILQIAFSYMLVEQLYEELYFLHALVGHGCEVDWRRETGGKTRFLSAAFFSLITAFACDLQIWNLAMKRVTLF